MKLLIELKTGAPWEVGEENIHLLQLAAYLNALGPVPAMTFERETHTYRIASGEVHSVTRYLSGFSHFYPVESEKMHIGSRVHEWTIHVESGEIDWYRCEKEYPEACAYLRGYQKFLADYPELKDPESERRICSPLGYAGSIDKVFDVPCTENQAWLIYLKPGGYTVEKHTRLTLQRAYSLFLSAVSMARMGYVCPLEKKK